MPTIAVKDLIIRPAEKDDVRPLAKLHVAAWKVAYGPILSQTQLEWSSVEREVRRNRSYIRDSIPFLVAETGGKPLGFILYDSADREDTGTDNGIHILSFWVHHEQTRQGIGTALLETMIKREKPDKIIVWVLTGVQAGPSFYEKSGFVAEDDTRRDFIFLNEPLPMVRYCLTRPRTIRRKK